MSKVRGGNYYTNEYISGNTVRKTNPQRKHRIETAPQRSPRSEKNVRPNEKALTMNAPYVAFLAVVSVVCLLMCVMYLNIQSDISETRTSISGLKAQISTIQSQNDALNYSINSYVDVDRIYKEATSKLGMSQAKDNQISKYKTSDSGYTVQYGDIPAK